MLAVVLAILLPLGQIVPPKGREIVCSCHPNADGFFEGGVLFLPAPETEESSLVEWPAVTIEWNGPPENRIDMTFVGDGFQAGQLEEYAEVVALRWAAIRSTEPYASYHRYFNAHRVDVASVDAGVDNDPTPGILRDTALDARFWCNDIERLLCVDTVKARNAALSAPGRDQVLVLANSTKYGGAGYPAANVSTFSAFSGLSLLVALHELGHSLGDLADEYFSLNGSTYTGSEWAAPNVSILTEAQMQASGSKWAPWIGVSLPGVGVHGTFEGGRYFQFGVRRPTENSLMRSIHHPFNGPSLEQMIVKIHEATAMIDAATPEVGSIVVRGTRVAVEAVQPTMHALSLQWHLGEQPIRGGVFESLDTSQLPVGASGATLRLEIVDPTPMVRNETLRASHLRETYTWTLLPDGCPADLDLDGVVGSADLALLLSNWGGSGLGAGRADIDGDGLVDSGDLALLLSGWGACDA